MQEQNRERREQLERGHGAGPPLTNHLLFQTLSGSSQLLCKHVRGFLRVRTKYEETLKEGFQRLPRRKAAGRGHHGKPLRQGIPSPGQGDMSEGRRGWTLDTWAHRWGTKEPVEQGEGVSKLGNLESRGWQGVGRPQGGSSRDAPKSPEEIVL